MTEEEWCQDIARRTGAPVEKVRKARARAMRSAGVFRDEEDYMDHVGFHRFERPELYPEG